MLIGFRDFLDHHLSTLPRKPDHVDGHILLKELTITVLADYPRVSVVEVNFVAHSYTCGEGNIYYLWARCESKLLEVSLPIDRDDLK